MPTSGAAIMQGGENGQIIFSNNSSESKLYNYLNLPLEDKMHMPPDGNSQLNDNEKKLIKMWIDSGAEFAKRIKINEDDFSNEILASLSNLIMPTSLTSNDTLYNWATKSLDERLMLFKR